MSTTLVSLLKKVKEKEVSLRQGAGRYSKPLWVLFFTSKSVFNSHRH